MTPERLLLIACIWLLSATAFAQHSNLLGLKPLADYEAVYVMPLAGDSLSSSFVIWIRQEVKAHYHASHAEQIYVLQGSARMQLNEETIAVKTGDYVWIPAGAVHAVKVTSTVPLKVLSVQSPQFEGKDRIWTDPPEEH